MRHLKYDRRQIFQFIIDYKRKHDGNSPTLREIMEANAISSNSAMRHILKQMEEQGSIIYGQDGDSRSIQVVGGQWNYHG